MKNIIYEHPVQRQTNILIHYCLLYNSSCIIPIMKSVCDTIINYYRIDIIPCMMNCVIQK